MKKKTKGDVIVNVVIILIGVEPPLISTQAFKKPGLFTSQPE
jgi:hypothetical protein